MSSDRVGESYVNSSGTSYKIINYNNSKDVDIEFEDGYIMKGSRYYRIKNGLVRNPYTPSCSGVGFVGKGVYNSKKHRYIFDKWCKMLSRSYAKDYQKQYTTYKDVIVCEEWHNFQNFAKWFEENYVEGWFIDKDILCPDCKEYSPENCYFVPREINNLFTKRENDRGELPIGVTIRKDRYLARISKGSRREFLGSFDTPEEAFKAYKITKEKYIKQIADKWKGKIDDRIYEAMYKYEVKITD